MDAMKAKKAPAEKNITVSAAVFVNVWSISRPMAYAKSITAVVVIMS